MITNAQPIPRKRNSKTPRPNRPDRLRTGYDLGDGSTFDSREAERLDAEAREIAAEAQLQRDELEADERQIHLIPIDQLARHPSNRKIDPEDPGIKSLAESIKEHGQLDPLRVRQVGSHRYQIISGERRFTAMGIACVPQARCIVVNIGADAALREVAVANSNREDLNAVQRAELMQQLMLPTVKGGSDLGLMEAGRLFGLSSESGCKNAIRILKLPKAVTDLIKSGSLPERAARRLVPFCSIAKIEKTIVESLRNNEASFLVELLDESVYPRRIEMTIDRELRPVSPDLSHDYYYPTGRHGCLFDWKAHAEQLQIVDIPYPIGDWSKRKIEIRKFALNAKLWDKLNAPLLKVAIAEREAKSNKGKARGTKAAKKLTPAQEQAEVKRKAKESEEQLDRFSREWLCRLMRCAISESSDMDLVLTTLPWLVGQCDRFEINRAHENAIAECRIDSKKVKKGRSEYGSSSECLHLLPLISNAKDPATNANVVKAFWRVILWPVSQLIGDEITDLTPSGKLPEKLITFGYSGELQNILQLSELANVSLDAVWKDGATDGSDQRRLISVWLTRHTKDQLHKLRSELHVTEGSSTMGRNELAGCILAWHRPGKPLPVPKRLQKLFKS